MVWKGDAAARLARSLITLIDQVDALWPNRDRSADGSIGDADHQARQSDHNPNAAGVVTALDLDRDLAAGFHARALAEVLVASRDPRIKYIISNGQIVSSKISPWVWRPYTGVNAHREHIHISVDGDPALYDDPRPWAIARAAQKPGVFTGITATVFDDALTAYGALIAPGHSDRPGVALPARFDVRPLPTVRVTHNGRAVICPVIDVGPWNTRDPYWLSGARPQAETGIDLSGRPTNRAGIDLTPAAARIIGLPGKGLVDWDFIKESDMSDVTQTTDQRLDTVINHLTALTAALEAVVNLLKGKVPAAAPEPPKPVAPVVAPVPVTPPAPTPILDRPGVGAGTALGVITAILQTLGMVGAPIGDTATTTGQLLPIIAGGTAALGATGWIGLALRALGTVASLRSR